jgi:predicted secreted hydrolase
VGLVGELQAQQPAWIPAGPAYQWSFPRDHWAHPGYKTEWWYFTGHMASRQDPDRRFGYQFTFFRVGLASEDPEFASAWATPDLIMGHAAVTDLAGRRHRFSELLYRTTPFLGHFGAPGESTLAWSRAPAGTDGIWSLRWNGDGFDITARDDAQGIAFQLQTRARKRLVFQGPNGYSRKGDAPTAASLYYSFTRLETEGTIIVDAEEIAVRGESWMDKEFGSNQLDDDQVGWDWFSLQLTDGRELMVYRLRSAPGGDDFGLGTLVAQDGTTRFLEISDWILRATRRWRSPTTGAEYPAAWTLTIPSAGLDLEVAATLADQENVSQLVPDLFYWEGAVTVRDGSGAEVGRGYVELTGYGTRSRPAI